MAHPSNKFFRMTLQTDNVREIPGDFPALSHCEFAISYKFAEVSSESPRTTHAVHTLQQNPWHLSLEFAQRALTGARQALENPPLCSRNCTKLPADQAGLYIAQYLARISLTLVLCIVRYGLAFSNNVCLGMIINSELLACVVLPTSPTTKHCLLHKVYQRELPVK